MSLRLALIALVAMAAVAHATPAQELEKAREQFRAGQFEEAIPGLNFLLYPNPRLSQEEDLIEARVLLAVCLFESGDRTTAATEFNTVLAEDLGYTLDTLLFSDEVVRYFDDLKKKAKDRADKAAIERREAEDAALIKATLDSIIVYETRPYYVNFIPFGAGQFQNEHRAKGLFFAASQGITGGLSAGIWLYLVGEFGLPGQVPPERVAETRRLQQIEIGAGALCLGLMAWGIIDSLVNYEPQVRRDTDRSDLPPDVRKKLEKLEKPSVRLEPTLVPGGAGVSFTWEL